MSDDDFDTEDNDGIGQLRKHAKQLADEKKALEAELQSFRAEQARKTVESVLEAKGLNPKVAKLYSGDASEDAVSQWVTEYGDVFGAPAQADPNAQAAAAVSAASGGGSGMDEAGVDGATRRVFGDPAEIAQALKTLPYSELVRLGYMPNQDPFNRPHV